MKIRDRRLIAAAGWAGTRLIHALAATLRCDHQSVGPAPMHPQAIADRRVIYALWHDAFLMPIIRFGHPGAAALVSSHTDGQMLGSLIRSTGMGVVHGSTRRGGVTAVRQVLRPGFPYHHLAVTPDGPRGPRRCVQPGIIYLAARTRMPIVAVAAGYRFPWRMKSWDAFAVPRPFSRARFLFGEPIAVPSNLGFDDLEPYRVELQTDLDRLTAAAEGWAETGSLQTPSRLLHARIPVPTRPMELQSPQQGVRAG